ncbi:cobalt-precorrin-6A reductase [Rhizobiaceae bacterium BDR2-2]|uniref:Cobalt-precorrin-6A reductase n=1 Tax=Ectorhizobium quercum TaxID=2965071 RepID=A0AAE3MZB1_9HYPH|nr:cobalt-precorrin-6A reductase [Ectorhizobium quercum]MCX8998058.1 cobalt-precorrin-6A reductase [Ectorhizobium quercum]
MKPSLLILGGTTEARQLAAQLSQAGFDCLLSLAGRTKTPAAQPVPVRTGGFGGAEGLAEFLKQGRFDLLVDATHPYAAKISANAARASALSGVPLVALRRPGWQRQAGDDWRDAASVAAAVSVLGDAPRRVFVALGRNELLPFEAAPQHRYLIRSVDPVEPPLALPDADYITARGPFPEDEERALLEAHGVEVVVSKNSGGEAAYGKIAAARALGLPVVMIARPVLPEVESGESVEAVADMVLRRFSAFLPGSPFSPPGRRGPKGG